MFRHPNTSSALALLLLTGTCLLSLSSPSPVGPTPTAVSTSAADVPWLTAVASRSSRRTTGGPVADDEGANVNKEEEEEDDELFKDVDPKTLAAVLLEALNKPQTPRGTSEEEKDEDGLGGGADVRESREDEEEEVETTKDIPKELPVRSMGGVNRDRDRERDREQPEMELVMAAAALQGREEREREEELERKKAQEEEERLTEKVTSRTVSHMIPAKPLQQEPTSTEEETTSRKNGQASSESPAAIAATPLSDLEGEARNDEEEEQLNPEELKNLETMMKEFPSLGSAASKRDDGDLGDGDRASRGFNDVLPPYKGQDLPMTKKKLKWQEETQKGMMFPSFRGGNFMDEFEEPRSNAPGDNSPQISHEPSPATNDMMEDDAEGGDDQEDDEERDNLSPEEEEAQAKAEQEEVRRQAAEVQRAKIEEEKLADIASDMLLQYMVKQNGGKRKYREQNRKHSSLLNTAEDKRSNEVQEVVEEEDDDIDPQTIDKLIEISSKLHLPADDVVDIINDVEKKKKKDVASQIASLSPWLRPSSSSLSSMKGMSMPQMPINQNSYPSPKQPLQAVKSLKTWFQEDPGTKLSLTNQDLWRKPLRPQPTNLDIFPQLQKSLSTNNRFISKPQRTFWGSYPPYTAYPRPYQTTPSRGYYPIYFTSPPKPKARYYTPKAYPYAVNNLLGNSARYDYNFPPKRHFHNWVQPRLRKPPASLQRSYYKNHLLPTYLQTFQRAALANSRNPSQVAVRLPPPLPPRNRFYYPPPPAVASRDKGYYDARVGNQVDDGNYNDVDVQQMLAQRLRKFQ